MMGELNRELNLGLATAVSVGRTLSAVQVRADQVSIGRVVVIGASNAGSTATALVKMNTSVYKVTRPGWALTKEAVEAAVQEVEAESLDNDVYVIQALENSTFFLVNEETGNMALPAKGEGDIYHVTGRVHVSKEMQLELLLARVEPLLKMRQDRLKILICPLPRFLEDCCGSHSREEDEKVKEGNRQMKELWEMRRGVKSFLITKKVKNVIMLDPLEALGVGRDLAKIRSMMADNFHLKPSFVKLLAESVKKQIKDWQSGGKCKGEEMEGEAAKRMRMDGQTSGSERGSTRGPGGGWKRGGFGPNRGRKFGQYY